MSRMIITIDGPAGSGKSTVARLLAEKLDMTFLDTGAMYRAVTFAAMQENVNLADEKQLLKVLNQNSFEFIPEKSILLVCLNGIDITHQIRSAEVTANTKFIASTPKIREKLVQMQRNFAAIQKKVVTEGRDQGTVAFPNANIKIFLTADLEERARRRQKQPEIEGGGGSIEEIKQAIEQRDLGDLNRKCSPLTPPKDAKILDTTEMEIKQVIEEITAIVREKCKC